jgi:Uma2 family endonuclease
MSIQNPIRIGEESEPEPDVALLRPRADFYAGGHPTPADVLLLVEVVDTSLRYERDVKVPLYARAGIPEVWLLILGRTGDSGGMTSGSAAADGAVAPAEVAPATRARRAAMEVCRQPSPEGYREVRRLRRGQRLAPLAFPDVLVSVDDLLGTPATPETAEA